MGIEDSVPLERTERPVARRPRGRPVDPSSSRQRALRLIQELYDGGVDRKDILGRVTDDIGVAPATATAYVHNFYKALGKRGIICA